MHGANDMEKQSVCAVCVCSANDMEKQSVCAVCVCSASYQERIMLSAQPVTMC